MCKAHVWFSSLSRRAHALKGDRSGSVALVLSLALPVFLGLVGGAVDFAAASRQKSQLQAAVDAAALSIVRQMTLGPVPATQVQELASLQVSAVLGDRMQASVRGQLMENGLAVRIDATSVLQAPLGVLKLAGGDPVVEATALARVTASSVQTKLCVLALGEKLNGGIFLHNNAILQGPECTLHSNSANREAVIVQQGSKLIASLLCSKGGISNFAGQVQATLVTDCPRIENPLAQRAEPPVNGPCLEKKLTIKSGIRTLAPGVYCDGLRIEGTAKVTFSPGVFVFRDGALSVQNNAEIIGQGVTFMFAGKKSYFRFLDNSLINLSAPATGLTAGMLLWESRFFVKGLNSWQHGGCGGNGDDDDDDNGSNSCAGPTPGSAKPKKTNEHHINSDRARELTGTIYLRDGLLLIDSRRPIADLSPFTVLVVNKLDLYDGPQFMLNSNYKGSTIPVPVGLGAIGATKVRLGM